MRLHLRPNLIISLFAVAYMAMAFPARAADTLFHASLIWGTDEMKPDGHNLREVESKTKDKLKAIFKWKNYFEVDAQDFKVATNEFRKIKMSSKCEVEVHNLGKDGMEIKLFGEGQLVKKIKQQTPIGESLVLAGDDKNASAWFVILTPVR